jgi:copper chaperone CopZ
MRTKLLVGSASISLLLASFTAAVSSAEDKISANSLSPHMVLTGKSAPATALNLKALHRLDFVVKGKSCASCLFHMQKRVEALPGVAKCGVMLKKPYAGVVIYDSTKVNQEKILKAAKGDETLVSFDKIEDAPIDKVPLILIPHHATDADSSSDGK